MKIVWTNSMDDGKKNGLKDDVIYCTIINAVKTVHVSIVVGYFMATSADFVEITVDVNSHI